MNIKVIYEDDDILAIDKPAHIETIVSSNKDKTIEDIFGVKNVTGHGIVHRLDKDTSGVMVIAKNDNARQNIQKQFKDRTTNKLYIALVFGSTKKQDIIKSYIARDSKRNQAMKSISFLTGLERGKPRLAETHYKKINTYKIGDNEFSLLEVNIKTGRTHQIRVHMQSIGCPILGDKMYNTKLSKNISEKLGIKRQFLHAKEIEINHPSSGKRIKFESPLPDDLQITDKLSIN